MWWMDGFRTDDGTVGAPAVCSHRDNGWREFHSYLGTGRMQAFKAELWAIGNALRNSAKRAEVLLANGITTLAIFSVSQAAIRWMVHLDPGPGQQLGRSINEDAKALRDHCVAVEIYWVPEHSRIPKSKEADHQTNKVRESRG